MTTKPTIRDHLPKLSKLLDLADKHGVVAYSAQINRYGAADLQLDRDSTAAVDAIADELGMTGPAEMYSGIYSRRVGTPGNLIVARLTVPAGAVAYLGHQEHGYLGIGHGTYVVRRQREQADELRMVAD